MSEENVDRVIHWNKRLEEYFSSTGEKAHCMSWLHKKSEAVYSLATTFIDLPVIIISGVVGAMSIGTESLFGKDSSAPVVLGALSIFVGVLNTIGAYFAWAKRSELHRVASIQYAKMYRQMNVEMSLPRNERTLPDDLLKYVRNEYERLSEISPLIPPTVIKKFNRLFKDETEISQPEEVNGLEKIEIFKDEDMTMMAKGDVKTLAPDLPTTEETVTINPLEEVIGVEEEKPVMDSNVIVSPLPDLEAINRNSTKLLPVWK